MLRFLLLLIGLGRSTSDQIHPSADPTLKLALRRITPDDFERTRTAWKVGERVAIVLFCNPIWRECARLEWQLASAAITLAVERLSATVHLVDTSAPGGEELRQELSSDTQKRSPTIIVFSRAVHTVYEGSTRATAVAMSVRGLLMGQQLIAMPPTIKDDVGLHSLDLRHPADGVLDLQTSGELHALQELQPLTFVLFYEKGRLSPMLDANYSSAAKLLFEQRVPARMARVEVDRSNDVEGWIPYTSRVDVYDFPEIKMIRKQGSTREMVAYGAGASTADLVDVARWNVGQIRQEVELRVPPRAVTIDTLSDLGVLLAVQNLVLIGFTTRWCLSCIAHYDELEATAHHLMSMPRKIAVAKVHVDGRKEQRALLEHFGVAAFPAMRVVYHGRHMGSLSGGLLAHEMVREMLSIRDELAQAEEAAEEGLRAQARGEL